MATKKSTSTESSTPESVVIEGSVTPAVGVLKRGKRAVVPYTTNIIDLVSRGFIDIVKDANPGEVYTPPAGTPITPTVPTVPGPKPDQTVPSVPSGTNQDLVEATPIEGTDQSVPEVANPDVDNSLVDVTVE